MHTGIIGATCNSMIFSKRLYGDVKPRRIGLPTYPFVKKRYWINGASDQVSSVSEPAAVESGRSKQTIRHQNRSVMMAPVWDATATERSAAFPQATDTVVIVGGTGENRRAVKQYYPNPHEPGIKQSDTIDTIAEKLRSCGTVDHLLFIAPDHPLQSFADDRLIEDQGPGVGLCFRVIKALLDLGYGGRNLGWTVMTTQAQPIDKETKPAGRSMKCLAGACVQ